MGGRTLCDPAEVTHPARQTLRLAHRGDARKAPENTLPALMAALELPTCDGLEFDVRLSGDRVPIVLHDESLEREQRRPELAASLTADQLSALGVPSLADVLAAVPRRAFLDVELKEDIGRQVVEVLAAGRGPSLANAAVSSFATAALERIRSLAPAWPCWLNAIDLEPETIATALELGCVGVSVEWHAIDPKSIDGARAHGLAVVAWTVTRRPTFTRLASLGCSAVCLEGAALDG